MLRILTTLCLAIVALVASAQASDEVRALEGRYLFVGTDPYCPAIEREPAIFYECNITANDKGQLLLTGFIGEVDNAAAPYYTGTYDPETKSIYFCCGADADGERVTDADGFRYFIYDFTLRVGTDDEGRTTLSHTGPFWFYVSKRKEWLRASYNGLTFIKDAPLPTWNGNIIQPTHAASIDDLLTYSIEFEDAHRIAASGYDIQGIIYDEDGHPYAIALVNGIVDAFGSMYARASKAVICFERFTDLNPQLSPAVLAAMRTTRPATPGQATVVFRGKSFKIDGTLIQEELVNVIDLGE